MGYVTSEITKIILAIALIPLVVLAWRHARAGMKLDSPNGIHRFVSIWLLVVLGVIALGSAVVYYRAGWSRVADSVDGYDVFHYYLNSKYFDELGYDKLYTCAVIADLEGKNHYAKTRAVRRLSDYKIISKRSLIVEDAGACKKAFTPERWKAFVTDVAKIKVPRVERGKMLADRGYNATPVWTLAGSALASTIDDAGDLSRITRVDLFLVIAMLLVVGWAYGPQVGLFLAIFLLTMWSTRWPMLGSALLRLDWIVTAVVGMALVRKRHYEAGGAFLAWSALSRLFPAVLIAALVVKFLAETINRRELPWRERVPRRALRFLVGVGACSVFVLGAAAVTGGTDQFKTFASNISVHTDVDNISMQRVGMPIALAFRGEFEAPKPFNEWYKGKKDTIRTLKPLNYLLGLLALGLIGLSWRHHEDDEAVALGFCVFFLATFASYYYFVFLLVVALIHLKRIHELRHAMGFVALLGTGILAYYLNQTVKFRYTLTASMSVYLAGYVAYLMTLYMIPTVRDFMRKGNGAEPPAGESVADSEVQQPSTEPGN